METYRSLNDFLIKHRVDNKYDVTHTRIGDGKSILPGKYGIKSDEMEIFYKLYHRHVFVENKPEYLTEKQLQKNNQILVDFDFRYEPSIKTRQHSEEHLEDLANHYIEAIVKYIYKFDCETQIPVYIMEKSGPNTTSDKVTKDGIHMVIGIQMDHKTQQYLRKLVLRNIDDVFGDLPLINDYDSVLDDGITKGHTNWQLYGSCKPEHEPYKVTKMMVFTVDVDDEDEDDIDVNFEEIDLSNKDKYNNFYFLKHATARAEQTIDFEMKEKCIKAIDEFKTTNVKIKPKKAAMQFMQQGFNFNVSEIKDVATLEKLLNALWEEIGNDDYIVKETHDFLMSLPSSYYDDYQKWIRCGWALHNTDFRLFISWMYFSSQSSKFNFDDIAGYYEEWGKMKNEGVTCRSIMYWSRNENPAEYKKIRMSTVDYYVEQSAKTSAEWDIAKVLFQLCKDDYRCADIKDKIWYEYSNNRWKRIQSGSSLRFRISKDLSRIYGLKADEYIQKSINLEQEGDKKSNEQEKLQKTSFIYADISRRCKMTNFKQNIMKEVSEHFYENDKEFFQKLDINPNLLCCTNGVIDFEEKIFRVGMPEDYVSLCTGIKYIPIKDGDEKQQNQVNEINLFMEQLFPDANLRKYMWEHLASVLIGKNVNQTFNIYNGSGSNGKSKLVDLMSMVLGEYKGVVPITLVTGSRNGVGSLSPEVAALKGIRYAVMNEPSKGDKLNDGVMKELTGEDPVTGRALYSPPVTFIPQFSLVVTTNSLFEITSNDDGTWRRIRLCDFESKFTKNPFNNKDFPEELYPYQFELNPKLSKKFEEWKETFLAMLVDIAFKTNGIANDCEKVLSASNKYRNDQDYFMEFKQDRIEKSDEPGAKIRKTEAYKEFSAWYKETYGKNVPKGKELYEFLDKAIGKYYKGGWHGYKIRYDEVDDEVASAEFNDDY